MNLAGIVASVLLSLRIFANRLRKRVLPKSVRWCIVAPHIRSQRLANVCGAHGWQSLAARWRQQLGFQRLHVHVVLKRGWQSLAKRS
jgi:hypothetical protein